METLHVADALTEIFNVFKRLNKYIDETEPWKLAKDEAASDRLSTVLYNLCEGIMTGASLLAPFLPTTADKIAAQLGAKLREFDQLGTFGLQENKTFKVTDAPEILFARLDKEEIAKKAEEVQARQREEYVAHQKKATANLLAAGKISQEEADAKLKALGGADAAEENAVHVETKEEITFDDFEKLQFVVGEIVKCEEVPKSKKLLCSQVKVGDRTVQIVSGIKAWYKAEVMVGKKVMVLLNLKPAKLAGVLSEGMLLCAEDAEGNVVLMTPEKNVPSGSAIG